MHTSQGVHPSVQVDGKLLKSDRKGAGYTQASFADKCDSVTLVTVRRAEQGNRIIKSSLQRMADVLGHPPERYVPIDTISESTEYVVSIAGGWTGFYIEGDRGASPHLVEENIELEQFGPDVKGDLISASLPEVHHKSFEAARVTNNIVFGLTLTRGLPVPSGLGSFMLTSTKNNDWLEGFRCWYDPDLDRIEVSRMIAVRANTPRFSQYIEEARSALRKEIPAFQLRKIMEAGYGIDDAFVMLSSLGAANADNSAPTVAPTNQTAAKKETRIEGAEFLEQNSLSYETLLEQLIALDYANLDFGSSHRSAETFAGSPSQWAPIYQEHPQNWRLLTQGGVVKGYWHFCALRPDLLGKAKRGQLLESQLSLTDIEPLSLPGTYSIYVTALVCDPKLRFGRPFKLLFDSIFIVIEELANGSVFIDEIVFAAWSEASAKLAERLGFEKIGTQKDTNDSVPIYKAHLHTILERDELREFSTLRHIYQKRSTL